MVAEIEEQRVMVPHGGSWMEWRAVCFDHGTDNGVSNWMARDTHENWIDAKLDAVEHDALEHQRSVSRARHEKPWEEIVHGGSLDDEKILPMNGLLAQHAI